MEKLLHQSATQETKLRPVYQVPQVTTYTDDEILDELGPAQACVYPCEDGRTVGG